ncbi:MAG: ThiF family adenylyltransferase [Candidatus Polarisedimenticolia bacterium]|nr:ThiF family adenylyltransferase [bacterium]
MTDQGPLGGRYSRQVLFAPFGAAGQERVRRARVLLLGCGGLGTVSANLLARAGVGFLRIVDRDVVELSNLQRQTLFDEYDVEEEMPKAAAAARRIARINRDVVVEPVVADVHSGNIRKLVADVDLIVDGFDNFEGRYLVNDAAVERGVPWVYGACIGAGGVAAIFVPGRTPCLRCLQPDAPPPGTAATCDTAGILGPAAHAAASLQCGLALRWLAKGEVPDPWSVVSVDVWEQRLAELQLPPPPAGQCVCCGRRRFDYLAAPPHVATSLCGRDAVQVLAQGGRAPDLAAIAERLRPLGEVVANQFLVRFRTPPFELTLFDDGRAIVKGTGDEAQARGLVARYFGV